MTINVPPPDPQPAAMATLRQAMRHLAGGVCVVTAGLGQDRTGLTVTSATALSLDPPTVIVCVNREASAWAALERYGAFCVNILSDRHAALADRFAGRGGEKGDARYAGARWRVLETGVSALADALAVIDCSVEEIIPRHSHGIVLGRARAIVVGVGEPLVYARGSYGSFRPEVPF